MFKLLSLPLLFVTVYGAGELSILQNPDSAQFKGQEQLDLSWVKNVFSSAVGFTIPEGGERWSGLVLRDPFSLAEGLVVVAVPGVASLQSVQGRTFPLHTDQPLDATFHALTDRFTARFPTADNLTLNFVQVDQPNKVAEYYGELAPRDSPSVEYLQATSSADRAFIDQINTLDGLTSKVAEGGLAADGVPDLHWISFPGLHPLVDSYGAASKQVQEANRILSSSILLLSEVFANAYDDKVLFAVLTSDAVHTRRFRRDTAPLSPQTRRESPDPEFAAMFNIFLWFSLVFFFVLLACSVGIAQMNPGRDSIIYRMTSNRMKKDL